MSRRYTCSTQNAGTYGGEEMVEGKIELRELDEFWYRKLHGALTSGEIRAIGRFAYAILKEMIKLSFMGRKEFPSSNKGYVLEKVMCIIQRTRLEDEVLNEVMEYMGKEDLMRVRQKIDKRIKETHLKR